MEGRLICQSCAPKIEEEDQAATSQPPSVSPTVLHSTSAQPPAKPSSESEQPTSSSIPKPRNKGGRPKGSTNAKKLKDKIRRKEAVNYVCFEYASAKDEAAASGTRVADGLRETLCKEAKSRFEIKNEFNVPRSIIQSQIKAERLVVWSPGPDSPVLELEVILNVLIITAWECNYPLTVGE